MKSYLKKPSGLRAFIWCDYGEDQSLYTKFGVDIGNGSCMDEECYHFKTGDPVVDYNTMTTFLMEMRENGIINRAANSSSVDHFFMDGDLYKEKIIDKIDWMDYANVGKKRKGKKAS